MISFGYFILLLIIKPSMPSIFIGVGVIYLAFILPDEWIKRRARRRKAAIARELPVVLNTLAIVTEAGLNLIPAIQEVCLRERGALINELNITLQEIAMGQAQGVAFVAMAKRCGQPELAQFVSILVQGLEKGSSGVVKILKGQARECWLNRRKHAEELAQKASFKLFLPLLIFFFPAMAMLVLGPAVLIMFQNLTNF
jgi:tight adherence protein C